MLIVKGNSKMSSPTSTVSDLYLEDETAWLELMAERIKAGELRDLDYSNLGEYLADMAKRDRREVESRLIVLLIHILKWEYQPDQRTRSWSGSILEQGDELTSHADRGVLRLHAEAYLPEAYRKAVRRAAAETGLPVSTFPSDCKYTLAEILDYLPEME
jgi:hypothetical protein